MFSAGLTLTPPLMVLRTVKIHRAPARGATSRGSAFSARPHAGGRRFGTTCPAPGETRGRRATWKLGAAGDLGSLGPLLNLACAQKSLHRAGSAARLSGHRQSQGPCSPTARGPPGAAATLKSGPRPSHPRPARSHGYSGWNFTLAEVRDGAQDLMCQSSHAKGSVSTPSAKRVRHPSRLRDSIITRPISPRTFPAEGFDLLAGRGENPPFPRSLRPDQIPPTPVRVDHRFAVQRSNATPCTWRLVCAWVFSIRPCSCRRFSIREIWL